MRQATGRSAVHEFPFFMAMPAVVWQVLFFYIPLAIIVVASFVRTDAAGTIIGGTFAHYKELIGLHFARIIARSFALAFATACSSLLIAYPVAYYLARKVTRAKNILLFLLMLPFWTNFLIQLYAWFFLLERNGLINTFLMRLHIINAPLHLSNSMGAVFIVMLYCYVPFMIMPVYSALDRINPALLEASADLGANRWQRFWSVTFPLSMSGVTTGFFLVFVPALSEFVIPALLGGAKYMYIGSLISYYFLVARNFFLGAAFTCLVGCILLVLGVLFYWFSRMKRR